MAPFYDAVQLCICLSVLTVHLPVGDDCAMEPGVLPFRAVVALAVIALALLVAFFPWLALRVTLTIQRARRLRTADGLRRLDPTAFERTVGAWFARDGWIVEHRGRSGDAGIDLLAFSGGEVVAVQCKRYAEFSAVSPAQVRELYGAAVAVGATRAMLVTTGRIGRSARQWRESLAAPVPVLEFVDGERLVAVAAGRQRIG
jgi:HJR/Mrr/RecB family endonuclease